METRKKIFLKVALSVAIVILGSWLSYYLGYRELIEAISVLSQEQSTITFQTYALANMIWGVGTVSIGVWIIFINLSKKTEIISNLAIIITLVCMALYLPVALASRIYVHKTFKDHGYYIKDVANGSRSLFQEVTWQKLK